MIKAKKYDHLIGSLPGFSPRQIEEHIKLYVGYVKKINEIHSELDDLPYPDRASNANFSYGKFTELKRREPVAFNGVYLHELYFENLGGKGTSPSGAASSAIEKAFGSLSDWQQDLAACAEGATGGWVLLTWDELEGRLRHNQIWEHSHGIMIHQRPVLALDAWEHAFMIDFGTDKKAYLSAFLENVNWPVVAERLAVVTRQPAILRET